MTGAAITIDARLDDAAARAVFAQLRAAGADLTPVMQDIGDQIVTNTLLRFETGRGPGGVPWKPSRRAREEGGQTLIRSGILRGSVHREASARDVIVGTNIRYAAIQQFGGDIVARKARALRFRVGDRWITKKKVTLPPRPYLGLDDADRADILEIATDHLRRASDGAAS